MDMLIANSWSLAFVSPLSWICIVHMHGIGCVLDTSSYNDELALVNLTVNSHRSKHESGDWMSCNNADELDHRFIRHAHGSVCDDHPAVMTSHDLPMPILIKQSIRMLVADFCPVVMAGCNRQWPTRPLVYSTFHTILTCDYCTATRKSWDLSARYQFDSQSHVGKTCLDWRWVLWADDEKRPTLNSWIAGICALHWSSSQRWTYSEKLSHNDTSFIIFDILVCACIGHIQIYIVNDLTCASIMYYLSDVKFHVFNPWNMSWIIWNQWSAVSFRCYLPRVWRVHRPRGYQVIKKFFVAVEVCLFFFLGWKHHHQCDHRSVNELVKSNE